MRETYELIDLKKLQNNVRTIVHYSSNYKYHIAVVKADCYGLGIKCIESILKGGANYLAVSSLDEALKVRKITSERILVLEPIDINYINLAIQNNITLTISSLDYLMKIKNKKFTCHIKINTGMNRLGISSKDEFNKVINLIEENNNVYLEGLFTHFATPGINDKYFDMQVHNFKNITSDIDIKSIPIVHLSSSFILLAHPKIEFANGVRFGTILYGYDISPHKLGNGPKDILRKIRNKYLINKYNISETYSDVNIKLTPALKVKTNIIQIKYIHAGDKVGYGMLYTSTKDEKIATIPIGFDDGIGISHINRYVIINNKKYPVIGEISMCMMSILIDDSVKLGDEVTVLGDGITLGMISRLNNTSIHNTLVNIGKTLPREYIKNNKIVATVEYRSEVIK